MVIKSWKGYKVMASRKYRLVGWFLDGKLVCVYELSSQRAVNWEKKEPGRVVISGEFDNEQEMRDGATRFHAYLKTLTANFFENRRTA
jgi:hypothetical protein